MKTFLTSALQVHNTCIAHIARRRLSMTDTFLYFGFGSNLLRERILINNPTAVFKTIAKLDNYQLQFDYHGRRWHGAAATITSSPGDHVWGVVWEVNTSDLENIDRQEGVHKGIYKPIEVSVVAPSGDCMKCRSYQLLMTSEDKLPSPQYLSVIRRGAAQNDLPQEYQEKLAAIEHNGYTGEVPVLKEVEELIEKFKKKDEN